MGVIIRFLFRQHLSSTIPLAPFQLHLLRLFRSGSDGGYRWCARETLHSVATIVVVARRGRFRRQRTVNKTRRQSTPTLCQWVHKKIWLALQTQPVRRSLVDGMEWIGNTTLETGDGVQMCSAAAAAGAALLPMALLLGLIYCFNYCLWMLLSVTPFSAPGPLPRSLLLVMSG